MKYQNEEEMLQHYNSKEYVTPDGYTADIGVFTIELTYKEEYKPPEAELKLLLIQRAKTDKDGEPHTEGGKWALPGGFVKPDETASKAAVRELSEEASVNNIKLKHFGVYDTPGRDKRGWIISNAFYAIVTNDYLEKRKAADDAENVGLFTLKEIDQLELAFDHKTIIHDAFQIIRKDLLQTTVAKEFLPKEFTLSELRSVLLLVSDDPGIVNNSAFVRDAPKYPFLEVARNQKGEVKKTNRTAKQMTRMFRFKDFQPIPSIY
ncbi:NUDIX hydrolase [Rossellomorea vietnamensis]|uniref:NUDIX hydrolase n=1 Tax=Rossellomorea vietnamensis TaxID=218284 RepID=A0A5D4MIU9_9BACI|nr:NUDIX hydrolase [Rossellomorea vietnamensis]TYS01319.1 NUDIX hydrolase [Rossellomorea vietnamensis]